MCRRHDGRTVRSAACGEAAAADYGKSMQALSTKNAGKATGITDAEQKQIAEAHGRAVQCKVKLDTPRPPQ